MPMDDYELVLGMRFFNQLGTLILLYETMMVVLDPKCPCVVRGKKKDSGHFASKMSMCSKWQKKK